MNAESPAAAPKFGLIIVGDEILSGKRADKHLPKWIDLLGERGLQLAWAEYVGDDPARITDVLRRAFASGDVVMSCGGIGATPDDHTRQCAAAALGVPLELHPEARALILERMRDVALEKGLPYEPERADNQHRLNMGVFPQGARIIPNPYNKIPGFYVLSGAGPSQAAKAPSGGSDPREAGERGGIFFVPGFPVMAWPMMAWVLDTYCSAWFRRDAWQEKSVIIFGAMEATLTPVMERVEAAHPQVRVFSLPSVDHPEWGVHIDLGVKGPVAAVPAAYNDLRQWLAPMNLSYGPELVRNT
ncbi:MAG: competence/damage-inducible protein A [Burkholderiaceae bacterium]|uniref:competence/damage-inducible protein A n=1 Tax=Ottowia sp. TaxID=1898956 RepID=UPI002CCD0A5D|nr:molybdopterin-binding protein [Ottowia sp.]MCP5257762.1 competence/damage-inducible protein A [Burkholderiaceae bacterium]HPR43382.1 molybdopterin-binding protein [Ottowia sp.]HRW73354.1 molybdopterin-binding protein [Ottowia sp.]